MPYDPASLKGRLGRQEQPRVGAFGGALSVHSHTGYATEVVSGSTARAGAKDPVSGTFGPDERRTQVADAVACWRKWPSLAGWVNGGTKVKGDRALRRQPCTRALTPIGPDRRSVGSGRVSQRCHKIWCAVDCVSPVNPKRHPCAERRRGRAMVWARLFARYSLGRGAAHRGTQL